MPSSCSLGARASVYAGFCTLMLLLLFSACSRQSAHNGDTRPLIVVSIMPQTWFVTQIAGDNVRILVLAGASQNPHNYEPSPRQMKELSQSGVWVLSGTEFEISLLPKVKKVFPKLKIIDGTEGVHFRMLDEVLAQDDDVDTHSGDTYGIDRHTWLGEEPAKILAAHTRDALVFIDPEHENLYNENYAALISEIEAEFAELKENLAPLKGRTVFVYHPSFGYFLDEFGIHQAAIEAGGKEPGPRELSRLIALAKEEQAAAIFVQAQFPVNAARTAANAAGAELISLDPLAADWLGNIRLMGDTLAAALVSGQGQGE